MKVVWSRRAIQHLVALREFIAKDSEQNVAAVASRILKAVDLLQRHPEMGRPGRIFGTRELVIPDTPYIIIPYHVRRERLELIAVFHGRQKMDSETLSLNRDLSWPSSLRPLRGRLGIRK